MPQTNIFVFFACVLCCFRIALAFQLVVEPNRFVCRVFDIHPLIRKPSIVGTTILNILLCCKGAGIPRANRRSHVHVGGKLITRMRLGGPKKKGRNWKIRKETRGETIRPTGYDRGSCSCSIYSRIAYAEHSLLPNVLCMR